MIVDLSSDEIQTAIASLKAMSRWSPAEQLSESASVLAARLSGVSVMSTDEGPIALIEALVTNWPEYSGGGEGVPRCLFSSPDGVWYVWAESGQFLPGRTFDRREAVLRAARVERAPIVEGD
jgi:hypothetical protein